MSNRILSLPHAWIAALLTVLLSASDCSTSAFLAPTIRQKAYIPRTTRLSADTSRGGSESPSPPPLVAKPNHQTKDIVIIGGGLAGLSAALYASQMAPHRHVTILERQDMLENEKTTMASLAAAGMLAPQSERLPKGPLLDLCLASRQLYADFCNLVETLAASDEEGFKYLTNSNDKDDNLEPWSVGYVASGGFLAPAFAGDNVATWAPPQDAGSATWLDETQVRELEPNLHPKVVGGWWFPEDASVDSRRLTCSLRAACASAGVEIKSGANYEVSSLDLENGTCKGLWLKSGKYIHTNSLLVANGAWMRNLLPVPIEPHKGQSLSLRMPPNQPPLLRRVLFAQDSYIVPKADGRIVVGATVEAGSYDPNVTPAGLLHILGHALELVPGLADLPLEETWVGLRPTTPDKGPILGKTPWDNLFLAGGYWRNGVLLAPKTGQLLASLLADLDVSSQDQALLDAFGWDRFTSPEGGAKLAVNSRYVASMHPIHKRTSGVGVAASVGTELGVYSNARTAAQERQQDRAALWGDDDGDDDDALERAAQMGVQDAAAFVFGDDDNDGGDESLDLSLLPQPEMLEPEELLSIEQVPVSPTADDDVSSLELPETTLFEGSPDVITVPSYSMEKGSSAATEQTDDKEKDLSQLYQQIQENKAAQQKDIKMSESALNETKPDPGFRIYHVDSDTGESREVPPYTTPDAFKQMVAKEKQQGKTDNANDETNTIQTTDSSSVPEEKGGDSIFDGYRAIQDDPKSLEDAQKARKTARNGMSLELNMEDFPTGESIGEDELAPLEPVQQQQSPPTMSDTPPTRHTDLDAIYKKIQSNKQEQSVEMSEGPTEERPDPGFRIYRVDEKTGNSYMVPPYTRPEEMARIIAKKRQEDEPCNEKEDSDITLEKQEDVSLTKESQKLNGKKEETTVNGKEEYNEETYDGYTAIQQANSRSSRQDELQVMRAARQKNRVGASEIDIDEIGAQRQEDDSQ